MIKYKHREFTIFGPESQKCLLRNIPSGKGRGELAMFEVNRSQCIGTSIVIGLSLDFCL